MDIEQWIENIRIVPLPGFGGGYPLAGYGYMGEGQREAVPPGSVHSYLVRSGVTACGMESVLRTAPEDSFLLVGCVTRLVSAADIRAIIARTGGFPTHITSDDFSGSHRYLYALEQKPRQSDPLLDTAAILAD